MYNDRPQYRFTYGSITGRCHASPMGYTWGSGRDCTFAGIDRESPDVTVKAVNFAGKISMPVILLLDEVIGHMRERVELPEQAEIEIINRKQPTVSAKEYLPFLNSMLMAFRPWSRLARGIRIM